MPGDDGVEESFTAFVRASGERHLRVAVLLTGDWHAAEDLVQASLVKLYRAWPGVDQADGDPDAYLRRIMINTQRSWWRARWRREAPVAVLPDSSGGGDDADQRALAVSIRQALRRLSPRQRAVLVLRYYEDLPEAEIASLLGCSAGTVKAHAHRGLGALDGQWPPEDPPTAARAPTATGARSADGDAVLSTAGGTAAGEGSDPR
jgi:RNA polymerase sigma-70 factor (sigma-E family)